MQPWRLELQPCRINLSSIEHLAVLGWRNTFFFWKWSKCMQKLNLNELIKTKSGVQFPKPQIAIKEPTDRITIKHESWRLSGRFGFVQKKSHPARWLVQGTSLFSFFLSFFSCQDLWALWARVWRQIFYPLDKSAAKKKTSWAQSCF